MFSPICLLYPPYNIYSL